MLVGDWKVNDSDNVLRISGDSENKNFWIQVLNTNQNNISLNFMRSMYKHDGILRGKMFLGETVFELEKNDVFLLEVVINENIKVLGDNDEVVMNLTWIGGERS